jgi:hypothetical protein
LGNQNYYQILEVAYDANWGEIQRAYDLAKKTYGKNAIASYSLFDIKERERILGQVEEAYRVLNDPDKRIRYNQTLKIPAPKPTSTPAVPAASSSSFQPPVSASVHAPVATSPAVAAPLAGLVAPALPAAEGTVVVEAASPEVTGALIKSLREKKGFSLDEVADRTRINSNYLSFIEGDRFEFLPAEVYVRSYLKQFIQMIQCDGKLVDAYMKRYQDWLKLPKTNTPRRY